MFQTTLEPSLDLDLDFDVAIECSFKVEPPHAATHLIKVYKIQGWHPICWDCILLLKEMERTMSPTSCLNICDSSGVMIAHYCYGQKVIQGIQEL